MAESYSQPTASTPSQGDAPLADPDLVDSATPELNSGVPSSSQPVAAASLSDGIMFNVVIPLLLLLVAGGVVWVLGEDEPAKRPAEDNSRNGQLRQLPPVHVQRLRSFDSAEHQLELQVDGVVVPFREARVAAEVAGRVVFKADDCEAGSYVKKDQVLMRLDPTDYELEVQRLSRLQEQEYQALSEVDQEMANSKRLIDLAVKDVSLQQQDYDRQKSLPEGFASRAEIDRANRTLLSATQQLVTLENQLELSKKRRVRLEASERLAATQLRAAEVNLRRTEIRAPIEGVIVEENSDLNTFVTRGSTLVTIEDTSKVEVATNLRMDQLYWVLDQKQDQDDSSSRGYDLPETPAIIEYEMSGHEDISYRWRGRLLSYDGIGVDPVSRTVPVRVVVDSPTEYVDKQGQKQQVRGATALVRGMYVRVKLLIQPKTRLVIIPARALQPGNRVLQFVPDESVLRTAAANVKMEPGELDRAGLTAVSSSDDAFQPSDWEPGKAILRKRSVTPVDSLKLNDADIAMRMESDLQPGDDQMWVCAVYEPELTGESYVVVSPLSLRENESEKPVRAKREGMADDAEKDSANSKSTIAAQLDDAEDA
jgi:multidrug efflux pump subunit AcrA (membrane-fusion protein)